MSTGIMIVNLGTPDSPSEEDVKRYLNEFLLDKYVINKPWLMRQLLVRGVIIPRRYRSSARSYAEIWTERGSPLKFYGEDLVHYLNEELDGVEVRLAMRYQNPSIASQIQAFAQRGIRHLIVYPLFPQYASATVDSVYEEVQKQMKAFSYTPRFSFNNYFFDRSFYIEAICEIAREYPLEEYEKVLFSFHGLPKSQLQAIYPFCCRPDNRCCRHLNNKNLFCYSAQCYATAAQIAGRLHLPEDKYRICFQSRLGRDPWIEPFTSDCVEQLAQEGTKKVLVFSPSFVCDCLETTFEIENENREIFKARGGERLDLVRGLNDHPRWFEGIKEELVNRFLERASSSFSAERDPPSR